MRGPFYFDGITKFTEFTELGRQGRGKGLTEKI
jgi:hypothetical protein